MRASRVVNKFFLRKALRFAIARRAPESFSLEEQNWKNINYYSARILPPDGSRHLARALSDNTISTLKWNGNKFSDDASITLDEACESKVIFDHHYRGVRTKYTSAQDLIIGKLTLNEKRFILKNFIAQKLYNSRTRLRKERLQVLSDIVNWFLRDHKAQQEILPGKSLGDKLTIFRNLYGDWAFGHPHFLVEYERFGLMLDSLVESEDLGKSDSNYCLTGRALITLSDHSIQEQRHRDILRIQWIVGIFTGALAVPILFDGAKYIATAIQAYLHIN